MKTKTKKQRAKNNKKMEKKRKNSKKSLNRLKYDVHLPLIMNLTWSQW